MHVLLCNERFLFRFGADRVLILLGQGLRDLGHRVSVMGTRFDRAVVSRFASQVLPLPEPEREYIHSNEYTLEWLSGHWDSLFAGQVLPDVVVIGGWPFFAAIPFFRRVCKCVIFMDFGAVPLDGYSDGMLVTQGKLRQQRKTFLPEASQIVAISEFIRRSQSEPDSAGRAPTRSVLLGADHLNLPVWTQRRIEGATPLGYAIRRVEELRARGARLVLNLGRWEPGCYKNSEATFGIFREIRTKFYDSALLVLAQDGIHSPADLVRAIEPIGFPDDCEMAAIMQKVDLGLSVSLWEGFNLPLAEMQWLGRQALAFEVGAHPEVVAHPWYLCHDAAEMAGKALEVLAGRGLDPNIVAHALEEFRGRFRWQRFISEYDKLLEYSVMSARHVTVVDVTNSTRDPANSGVIRVTRRFTRQLQHERNPWFVVWDEENARYVLPTRSEYQQLGQFHGPVPTGEERISASSAARKALDQVFRLGGDETGWILITETVPEARLQRVLQYAHDKRLHCGAIFYDAIPVLRPDLCNEETRLNHAAYMTRLAECDVVVPISNYSAQCLEAFWKERGISECRIAANPLPGEFSGTPRSSTPSRHTGDVRILCVSTIEPRKNHRRLIAACEMLEQTLPELKWCLTLVGNRYAGAFELADWIESTAARNPRIRWLGIVDDNTLQELYEEATFTVYPSVIEGFGLPILESIWHARPCICSREGVMAELAAGGGCLTANVQEESSLSAAIARLGTDRELWEKLSAEAMRRSVKSWSDYTLQFREILATHPAIERRLHMARVERDEIIAQEEHALSLAEFKESPLRDVQWEDMLFPHCINANWSWQMNDSEKLGLTAVLSRVRPQCSIEVGTYQGGSLSLIAQYSETVISIDNDPDVPGRLPSLANVHFLTGDSSEILPQLLRQLMAAEIPIEFILLDGDHSTEGIQRDVACLLEYVPRRPLIVLLHDSFNPACRRGMLGAEWARSPHCHWVEIDFVPGRVVEADGPSKGQLWGGLAMAFFTPQFRLGELIIRRSSDAMYQMLSRMQD